MNKQVTKIFVPLFALLIFMGEARLCGQQQPQSFQQLKQVSISSFYEGDYRSAFSGFRNLMDRDSVDPQLAYYAGRCLVELNEDLDEAIELLYRASRQNGPEDALYYLGRAYHLHYNFIDARSCYEQFEKIASKEERKDHQIKHLIETCRSAGEITGTYNPYEVMNVTFMDLSDSSQYSQVKMKGGDLSLKPESYFHPDEERDAITALMFIPDNTARGDYVYYSGYDKNQKDGAQIFRLKKGNGNSWGDPQEISALNSEGNEIMPYFDPIGNDLYFASDGRFGIGGYDLYKSHYDMERDAWTEPVNLGFPVNSASDDYLLLPGSDLGMVLFFSSRLRTDSSIAVYRVHLVEPRNRTVPNDDAQLREIARLGGVAEDMRANLEASLPAEETAPDKLVNLPVPVYQETLALALKHQAVSDSLKDLAANARVQARQSEDPNDRWVWQKQIMVWEKKARDEEQMADELYARMEKERSEHIPESIEVDREIGDLKVYRYAEAATGLYEFEILDKTPYSASHPVPMDVAIPSGTFYRIQLGAFGMELEPDVFGGLSPITGEHMKEQRLVKYYAGKFSRYDDASSALPRIQSLGYEDAFIVAWYNGNQVSTQKAKQLE